MREREGDTWKNSNAASMAPCCICGQAVSRCNYKICVCVCVCIVLVTACQTAHCLCGKANMKGVKVHKQRRLMQYMHDYQDVQYVYI